MPSKYDPLGRWLTRASDERLRLSFREIEAILGFALPRSARAHPPWWANVGGSHVQAQSWMRAGWRTRQVDAPGEFVTFERVEPAPETPQAGVAEPGSPFIRDHLTIDPARLSFSATNALRGYLEESNGDATQALNRALEDAMLIRRQRLIAWFREHAPNVPGDSTDIIREARDAR
jgi:hypothetical protein